ncbi:helicase-associated domain-containing protein [Dictyobacter aurantiacus]|uniref:Helicase XPB/Ssl2 N-terminal domain-containing protein n=1 Tax=Dictyobacter aurantiacus TaxID=1936993 RepID=A0A401ZE26_9CHLR|nr:helicase-associated domain-containing protein [Dictyobacter aurantiacus]GCE05131.1 hypothetical protein KDAU_24600 [Dictyobacter aurantiacus]
MQEKLAAKPQQITTGETAFLYDVATLVNAVYQTTIELTREGNVPKRITKKIRPLLKGQERLDWNDNDIYTDMVMSFLLKAKIIMQVQPPLDNTKFRLAPGPGLAPWMKKNVLEQTCQLLESWQEGYSWIDVPRAVPEQGNHFYNSYTSSHSLRPLLLEQLYAYPAGAWYSVESLVHEIWEDHPELAKQQQWRGSYYAGYQRGASKKNDKRNLFMEWAIQAAPSFINMLYSSLIEMGVVDVGNDPLVDGNKLLLSSCAFRITELGEQAIERIIKPKSDKSDKQGSAKISELQKSLIVQPNYELLLLQPDLPTLYSLLSFTQVKQIQMVSTLLLTQSSVLRALQHGFNAEKMLTTLGELSQKELPQNVVYSLQDWVRQHKQATISQAMLLELSDEETATRLSQHPTLIKMNVRQLTPTVLAIPFDENGNINYQSIQLLLDKENISSNFLGLSKPGRYRGHNYY